MKIALTFFGIAAFISICCLIVESKIDQAYSSGFDHGTETMLIQILSEEIHLGPIVLKSGSVLSNCAVTVITWPDQQAAGVVIENVENIGSCYMDMIHTEVSHCTFDFKSVWGMMP